MTAADTLLQQAAAHLDAAADLADAGHTAHGHALAGQIRLNRAGILLDFVTGDTPTGAETITGQLRAALVCVDAIDPLDGPPDLPFWAWHLAELARNQTSDQGGRR